ncbi:MAG: glycosyltransferase family 4 protein [Gammaproteobacteria bacterium]|nr:glycosyltransferase family 4 protein [Gammaproteobacteria bacterium]
MSLTVLNVPFPFVPVNDDPIGGAEQIVAQLDRMLVSNGHRSIVIAADGSRTAGQLLPLPRIPDVVDNRAWGRAHHGVRKSIATVLASEPIDLIHLHGCDFPAYLPPPGPPVLGTLHLPIGWYSPAAFQSGRPLTFFNPVSANQARTAPHDLELLPFIENGVAMEDFPCNVDKRSFALVLGRICPEKGIHHAISASALAGVPLLIAGEVFPWAEHQRYFADEIVPRLDRLRRWIGPVAGVPKRRLLAAARCVLIPSLAPETSSLVAMEALASGTPVIAWRAGALPEIVDHGKTGYIVDDVAGMADAISKVDSIDSDACRAAARHRFAQARMLESYLRLYRWLADRGAASIIRKNSMGARAC